MAVSGLHSMQNRSASVMIDLAISFLKLVARVLESHPNSAIAVINNKTGQAFHLRIGINSGSLCGAVIGLHKFIYDVWGDSGISIASTVLTVLVNLASRLQTAAPCDGILVSESTRNQYIGTDFDFEGPIELELKGKGLQAAYLVRRRELARSIISCEDGK